MGEVEPRVDDGDDDLAGAARLFNTLPRLFDPDRLEPPLLAEGRITADSERHDPQPFSSADITPGAASSRRITDSGSRRRGSRKM